MRQFYTITAFLLLFQLSVKGQNQLTNREIYNFEVGDVFHTKSYDDSTKLTFTKRHIISKFESQNQDTIYYEVLDSFLTFSPQNEMVLDYSLHTIFYTDLDSLPYLKGSEDIYELEERHSLFYGFKLDEYAFNFFSVSANYEAIESVGLYYHISLDQLPAKLELIYFKRDTLQIGEMLPDFNSFFQLKNGEIYDYEVGDLFHFQYEREGPPISTVRNIVAKEVFPDSIRYQIIDSVYELEKATLEWKLKAETKWVTYSNLDRVPEINQYLLLTDYISVYDSLFNARKNIYEYSGNGSLTVYTLYEGIGLFTYGAMWHGGSGSWGSLVLKFVRKNGEAFGTPLSVRGIQNKMPSDIAIYPNPSNSEVTFERQEGFSNSQVTVYDINGRFVYQSNWKQGEEKHTINTSQWQVGVYYVTLQSAEGEKTMRKLMIVR